MKRLMILPVAFLAMTLVSPRLGAKLAAAEEKIDAPLLEVMEAGDAVPVLILGRTQFFDHPDGLQVFAQANATRKRSVLRREVIARLKEIADSEQPEILQSIAAPAQARRLWLINAIVATLTPDQIRQTAALDAVKYIYHGEATPPEIGDPGSVATVLGPSERAPFKFKGRKVDWNLKTIHAFKTWKKLKVTGEGALISMLDLGVDYTHQDLRANIWINQNEIPNNDLDDDDNGYADDYYGFDFSLMKAEVSTFVRQENHGTWTSGVAVGDGTGGTITGVAPRARLMPLVFDGSVYTSVLAHQYALEHGADVMNMSFSLPDRANLRGVWRRMADHAIAAGLVLVSGAGNFQQTQPIPVQQRIPEDIPSVISIGGVDQSLTTTTFSSLGPVEWSSVKLYNDYPMPTGLTKPDVVAFPGPGYAMLHPAGSGYVDPNPTIKGNSFSSPHVAGVAALMLSAAPELQAWRVKEILESTATDLASPGKDNTTGSGLVDAFKAVKAAIKAVEQLQ